MILNIQNESEILQNAEFRLRLTLQNLHLQSQLKGIEEWETSREHYVEHDAERPNILSGVWTRGRRASRAKKFWGLVRERTWLEYLRRWSVGSRARKGC